MKKITCTIILFLITAAAVVAQNPCTRTSPLTDQERFVQREIQSRIDESIEAGQAKDLAAELHYAAPTLTVKLVDGTVLDRRQIEEAMKRDSAWVLAVSDQTTVTIQCLELKGKEAVPVTEQHFVRTVPDRKDGSPHELITNVTHEETWAYGKDGWLTQRVKELKQGPTYLDGKLYVE
jgi:hypothetical protein